MKKILFAAAALVALVSCNNDEVISRPEGAVIGFDNTFVENTTRAATDLTKGTFDFGVYGTVAKDRANALIFYNRQVAADGTYSPVQYWVAGAEYTFTAFAPYTNAKWTYAATDAYNGTVTFDNAAALGEQDFIFANADRTTDATINAAPAKVGFTFGHMLSKVAFKFTNNFVDNNITLKVYNVKVNNAAANGTMPVVGGIDGEWTGADDYARAFGPATADEVATIANAGGQLTTEHFYLIPVERAYNITFDVDLYQAGVLLQTYNHEINTTIAFEKGKSYSVNAVLTPENVNPDEQLYPIEFQVDAVEEWVNATVENIVPVKVATVAELEAAIAAGNNVVLANDLTLTDALVVENDVTIDLGGKTVTYTGDDVLFRAKGCVVTVDGSADGSAVVTNPTTPGTGGNGYVGFVSEGGVLNIMGGSYDAQGTCTIAQVNEGTLNVYGGEFKVDLSKYTDDNGEARYLLNCSDANYNAGTAVINVYGGVFHKFNPADNAAEGAGTNFVAEGYTVTENAGVYTVSK